MNNELFYYSDERFADIQMLRYRLNGFEALTLEQKKLIYYLSEATLSGRDITFDQFGKHNLKIRKTLEAIYTDSSIDRQTEGFKALELCHHNKIDKDKSKQQHQCHIFHDLIR